MKGRGIKDKNYWICGIFMLFTAFLLLFMTRKVSGFGQWYAAGIYPVLVSWVGRLFGILPWSATEWGIYLLTAAGLAYGFLCRRRPLRFLSRLWVVCAGLLLLYALNCGINYYRNPFSSYMGLTITGYTKEELYALCEELTRQVNLAAEELTGVSADEWAEAGTGGTAAGSGPAAMGNGWREQRQYQKACVDAMRDLGGEYPQLSGFYPRPKPVTVSWILSVQQLSGIYSPFTIEANYNRDMTGFAIPHTMCHELSHLKGFMREDEANFIGYLACIRSGRADLRYSGYLTGWSYASLALAGVDPEGYAQIWQELHPAAAGDIREDARFWKQYEGKVAETAAKINNHYLKINDQKDGIRTYGHMVDLMLAYFFSK